MSVQVHLLRKCYYILCILISTFLCSYSHFLPYFQMLGHIIIVFMFKDCFSQDQVMFSIQAQIQCTKFTKPTIQDRFSYVSLSIFQKDHTRSTFDTKQFRNSDTNRKFIKVQTNLCTPCQGWEDCIFLSRIRLIGFISYLCIPVELMNYLIIRLKAGMECDEHWIKLVYPFLRYQRG